MSTEENQQLVKREPDLAPSLTSGASISELIVQMEMIHELLSKVLIEGTHYGKIPGTGDKLSLLQPGAQKLCNLFKLAQEIEDTEKDLGNGHREHKVKVTLRHYPTGMIVGEGVGSCSTMESKYRYRNVDDFEVLDDPIPKDSRERKSEYRKQGLGMKKVNGQWAWVRFLNTDARQENPDVADVYNTVLKMAVKRALVAATIAATGASDIFAQDMEAGEPASGVPASPPVSEPSEPKKSPSRGAQREQSGESGGDQTPTPAPAGEWMRGVGIKDVVEDVTTKGRKFWTVLGSNGVKAWTFDAATAAGISGLIFADLQVKPTGSGSLELIDYQEVFESPEPTAKEGS
jgi:uncharacterized protein YeeX (DUF496 family)